MACTDLTSAWLVLGYIAGVTTPGLSRIYGLGSVFAKSLRDARWTALLTGLALGGLVAVTAWQIGVQFPTVADRQQLAAQMTLLPRVFQGLTGVPLHIETMPGFMSWRVMSILPVIVGIWPVIALSGTL